MLKSFVLLFLLSFSLKVYSMSCKEVINTELSQNSFDEATALLELVFHTHSMSAVDAPSIKEHMQRPGDEVLSMKSYLVTLENGDQMLFQIKYLFREYDDDLYYTLSLVDANDVLHIFANKAEFYSSFEGSLPESNDPNENPEFVAGINYGFYFVQVFDEYNSNYMNDTPYSVEITFEDFSYDDAAKVQFKSVVERLVSNFETKVPFLH